MRSEKGFTLTEAAVVFLCVVFFLTAMVAFTLSIYNCGRGYECEDHAHGANGEVVR